ncbi:hypothetical protein HF325_004262 [Metschnikowia pulcherrima]|uniref:Uncharacterized protein n=1 Tax=Metschnikowia pulcherrima TaxID=27326 RepID=A0A8H7GSQ7_9ASCO|nr:hypothetical protein HF325_004262 [Metschnikowia pulcherrima]
MNPEPEKTEDPVAAASFAASAADFRADAAAMRYSAALVVFADDVEVGFAGCRPGVLAVIVVAAVAVAVAVAAIS